MSWRGLPALLRSLDWGYCLPAAISPPLYVGALWLLGRLFPGPDLSMPWQEPPLWEVTVCSVLLCLAVGVVTLAASLSGDWLTRRLRGGGAHRGVVFQPEPSPPNVMKLRFSARGDDPDRIVHLTVLDSLRLGDIVRRRGEALCRPKTSLPNLEPLSRQLQDGRRCCPECIDLMARARIKQRVDLPAASGVVAADLIRWLAQEREASHSPRRRRALPDRD